MAKNTNLQHAKTAKKDEFYTQLSDIERELKHYRQHFKDKIVLCNCDDPRVSNFFKYFVLNFDFLGLKEVIATCYKNQDADLFSTNSCEQAVYLSVTKMSLAGITAKHDGSISVESFKDIEALPLRGNGDFQSAECIDFLKRADIVCTNPPFSLFSEYVKTLVKYEKKFLIIGSKNALTYRDIFPLIKQNAMWLGHGFANGNAFFSVRKEDAENYAKGVYDEKTGLVKFRNVTWYTNLDYKKRHEPLLVYKKYNPSEYPKYDNYDAIEVSLTSEIPCDYSGVMGVPITFLDKYCPEQFDIIGATESEGKGFSGGLWDENSGVAQATVNGEKKYKRLFIRSRQ